MSCATVKRENGTFALKEQVYQFAVEGERSEIAFDRGERSLAHGVKR